MVAHPDPKVLSCCDDSLQGTQEPHGTSTNESCNNKNDPGMIEHPDQNVLSCRDDLLQGAQEPHGASTNKSSNNNNDTDSR